VARPAYRRFPSASSSIFFSAFIHRQTDIFFIKFSVPLLIGKILEVEKRGQRRHFLRVTIKNAEILMLQVQRQWEAREVEGGLLVSYSPYLSGGIFNGAFFLLQNLLFPHPP
jgi:hypothetical protein